MLSTESPLFLSHDGPCVTFIYHGVSDAEMVASYTCYVKFTSATDTMIKF